MDNMAKINDAELEGVAGGTIQDAFEYLEELRKKYRLATSEQVKEVWTAEEQFTFEMLLRQGVTPRPEPKLPSN